MKELIESKIARLQSVAASMKAKAETISNKTIQADRYFEVDIWQARIEELQWVLEMMENK